MPFSIPQLCKTAAAATAVIGAATATWAMVVRSVLNAAALITLFLVLLNMPALDAAKLSILYWDESEAGTKVLMRCYRDV